MKKKIYSIALALIAATGIGAMAQKPATCPANASCRLRCAAFCSRAWLRSFISALRASRISLAFLVRLSLMAAIFVCCSGVSVIPSMNSSMQQLSAFCAVGHEALAGHVAGF